MFRFARSTLRFGPSTDRGEMLPKFGPSVFSVGFPPWQKTAPNLRVKASIPLFAPLACPFYMFAFFRRVNQGHRGVVFRATLFSKVEMDFNSSFLGLISPNCGLKLPFHFCADRLPIFCVPCVFGV